MADDQETRKNDAPAMRPLDLTDVQVRRRNMLAEEASVDWNSYTPRASALCADLISQVAVEVGGNRQPDTFNTSVDDQFPDDVILIPTVEPNQSAIRARWTSPREVYFYFEKLLKKRPLAIPVGMKAFITFSRYQKSDQVGIRVHLSQPRITEIVKAGPKKKKGETAAALLPDEEESEQ